MRDEVEEFLRRAAQRRAQVESQARAQAQRLAQPQPQPAAPKPTPRLSQQADPLLALQSLEAEVIDAEVADLVELNEMDIIAPSANRSLRGSSLAAETGSRFAGHVGLADDDMDAHLRQTFDHKLGRLGKSAPMSQSTPAAATRSSQDSASESHGSIVRMLRTPRSLRDAIVVSEILRRPEHLWE